MIFGILSTFAAIVTEQIGEAILGILLPQSSTAYNVLLYFVVVALSEEGFKYLLLKKRTWYSSEFNASSTVWSTPCSSRSALPCGRTSAMC